MINRYHKIMKKQVAFGIKIKNFLKFKKCKIMYNVDSKITNIF